MYNNKCLFEEVNMLLDIINKLKFNKVKISDEEKLSLSMQLFKRCLLRSGVSNDGALYVLTRLYASIPFDSDKRVEFIDNGLIISNEDKTSFLKFGYGSDEFRELFITYKQPNEKETCLDIFQRSLDGALKITIRNGNGIKTNMYLKDNGMEVVETSTMNSSISCDFSVKLCRVLSREGYSCSRKDSVMVHDKEVSVDKKCEYLGNNANDLIVFPTLEGNANKDYDNLYYVLLHTNSDNLKNYFTSLVNNYDEKNLIKLKNCFGGE